MLLRDYFRVLESLITLPLKVDSSTTTVKKSNEHMTTTSRPTSTTLQRSTMVRPEKKIVVYKPETTSMNVNEQKEINKPTSTTLR